MKVLHSKCQQIWKIQQVATGLEKVSFHSNSKETRSALGEAHPAQLARLSADHHGAAAEGHLSGSAQLPGPDHGALQSRECAATHHGSAGQPLLPQGAGQHAGRGGVSWGPCLFLLQCHTSLITVTL